MNFSIKKNKLQNVLLEHSKVVPLRTTLPILSCVVLKTKDNILTLKTTDLEQTIVSNIETDITKNGEVAIPLGKFLEIVSAIQEEKIKISVNSDFLTEINSKQGIYKITGRETGDFPETPTLNKREKLTLKGKDLLDIIEKTGFAVSKDDLKPALCGVYFNINKETITTVATDGHKLVKYIKKTKNTTNKQTSIVLPIKFLNIVKSLTKEKEEVFLETGENHIQTKQGCYKVISRIIKENFPDFNSVIPEDNTIVADIKTNEIISSLKRVSIFSNKTTKQTVLSFSSKGLTISAQDIETATSAKEHLDCGFKGEEITTSYNAKYLIDVLQHIGDRKVKVYLKTPLTAALFIPQNNNKDKETTSLLMPIRLNQ